MLSIDGTETKIDRYGTYALGWTLSHFVTSNLKQYIIEKKWSQKYAHASHNAHTMHVSFALSYPFLAAMCRARNRSIKVVQHIYRK